MFFINKNNIVEFQNRCVIALFLDIHEKVRFEQYIEKNHFLGRLNGSDIVEDIYLFNVPPIIEGKEDKGTVYKYRGRKTVRNFTYIGIEDEFIEKYVEFYKNPYDYICNNFVKNEWEKKYNTLLKSEPIYYEQENNKYNMSFVKYKSNPTEIEDKLDSIGLEELMTTSKSLKYFMKSLGGELAFTKPDWLNDPFDCDCEIPIIDIFPNLLRGAMHGTKYRGDDATTPIDGKKLQEWWNKLDSGQQDEIIDSFENIEVDKDNKQSDPLYRKKAEQTIVALYNEYKNQQLSSNKIKSILERYCSMRDRLKNIKNEFRILSLAHNESDILMWGYYGNSGQGVCLKHKQNDIYKGINTSDDAEKYHADFCIYGEMNYRADKPKFNPTSGLGVDGILEYIVECVFTKYEIWQHEKEFRYVLMGRDVKNSGAICIQSDLEHRFMGVKHADVKLYKEIDNLHAWPDGDKNVTYLEKHITKYELKST